MRSALLVGEILGLDTWVWIALLVAMFFVMIAILFSSRYKRCPSNQVLVIFGKTRGRQRARSHPRRRGVRDAADSGLRLPEPGADSDRNAAARALCRSKTSASMCRACSRWPSAPSPM